MKNKAQSLPAKHVPQRTCVACRQTTHKRALVRLVCTQAGSVEVDLTGKKAGRGAYLCADPACWEKAFAGGKLAAALRTTIRPENMDVLVNYAKGFDNSKSPQAKA